MKDQGKIVYNQGSFKKSQRFFMSLKTEVKTFKSGKRTGILITSPLVFHFQEKQIRYGEDRRGKRPFSYYLEGRGFKKNKGAH